MLELPIPNTLAAADHEALEAFANLRIEWKCSATNCNTKFDSCSLLQMTHMLDAVLHIRLVDHQQLQRRLLQTPSSTGHL